MWGKGREANVSPPYPVTTHLSTRLLTNDTAEKSERRGVGRVISKENPWDAPVKRMTYVTAPPPPTRQKFPDRSEKRGHCEKKWRGDGSCTFWRGMGDRW